jgi:surface antigen
MKQKYALMMCIWVLLLGFSGQAALAWQAPWPPIRTSPEDDSVTTNPPNLCAQFSSSVGLSGSVRFTARGAGDDISFVSPWVQAHDGDVVCWKDNTEWPPGAYSWFATESSNRANSTVGRITVGEGDSVTTVNGIPVEVLQGPDPFKKCYSAPDPRLHVGALGRVLETVFLRRTPFDKFGDENIIQALDAGMEFVVLSGPVCITGSLESVYWWQIELTAGAIGYAPEYQENEDNYYLELVSTVASESVGVVDPLLMIPLPEQQLSMCVLPTEEESWLFQLIPEALAQERFSAGQCTDWIDQIYSRLIQVCLPSSSADAHRWNEYFSDNCGFEVSASPEEGDIAVWEQSPTRPYGHVAYVIGIEDDTVYVTEYNVTQEQIEAAEQGIRPDEHLGSYPIEDISFIHVLDGVNSLIRLAEAFPVASDSSAYMVTHVEDALNEDIDIGLFIYLPLIGNWGIKQYQLIIADRGDMLFLVDLETVAFDWNWEEYLWRYVYIANPASR